MKYRVRVLPEADRDIDRIYLWIAKHSPDGAARWYRRLLEVLEDLQDRPLGFTLAPEYVLVGREIRDINFKTRRGRMYRILFEVRNEEVFILHIRGPGQRLLKANEIREL